MIGVSCASLRTESCEIINGGDNIELDWHGAAGINELCVLAFVRCVFLFPRWPNGRRSSRWTAFEKPPATTHKWRCSNVNIFALVLSRHCPPFFSLSVMKLKTF